MMKWFSWIVTVIIWSPALHAQDKHWVDQEQAVYAVQFSTSLKTDFALLGNQVKDTGLTAFLKGKMQVVCTRTTADQHYSFCSFETIDSLLVPLPEKEKAVLRQHLQEGFYFSQFTNGIIDSLYFPHHFSESAEHFAVQLMEYYQYYMPAAPTKSWQKQLLVADGPVTATWQVDSPSLNGTAIRLISLSPNYDDPALAVISRVDQYDPHLVYTFSDQRLKTLKGSIIRKAKINHKTITTLTNAFQYTLLSVDKNYSLPAGKLPLNNSLYSRALYYPAKQLQRMQAQYRLKGVLISVADVLRRLQENEIRKEEEMQDKLAEDIRTCFFADKDSLSLFSDAFMQADVNSITFKTLRMGIVTSATPYAQQIVCDFIRQNDTAWQKLRKIIPAAGLMRSPLPIVQQQIEALAFNTATDEAIRSACQLALGNIAGNLRTTDSVRAGTIAYKLGSFLQHSNDDLLLLGALGNCGTISSLPFILPHLADSSLEVKGYAYYALRFIRHPMVDSIYLQALLTIREKEVLENVFNALFLRNYNARIHLALANIIEQHPVERIKLAALQVLFEWSYRRPQLLIAIKTIAMKNTNVSVRQIAMAFLAKSSN
jgi:hypothetical protein